MKRLLLLLWLCSGAFSGAALAADGGVPFAHPLSVEARPSAVKVLLGEPFTYAIAITHAADERYELKTPTDLGAFEVLGQSRSRKDGPSNSVTTFEVKLSLFELEKQKLPTLVFDVVTPRGLQRFELQGTEVESASTLPAEGQANADLLDIKPPEDVPVRSYRLLAILAGLTALAVAGYYLWKRLSAPKDATPIPVVVLPAHVRAEAALKALRQEDLPAQGKVREFYFRLSEILRGYLGERYGFEALECTSSELSQRVDGLSAPELPKEALKSFILDSDLVKFAKAVMDAPTCESALGFGLDLVQKTRPSPAPHAAPGPRLS